ncbi:hypothetical protein DW963_00850 [Eubacterium sp. AM46-8]|nr:hypothetical protein DW963_00850 [Eubacterium sp. AM46-8]
MSAKSKKIISGVLVAVMVAGSVIAGTSLKAGAYSKTQDVLDELLGAAKPYGVVADEFKNANHNQTCFATNNLVITDQWLSAWLDMSVGTTYIRSFDNTGSAEVFIDRNAFNNLVLGTDYDYVPTENKCYIKGADGKRTGAVINVNNCKDTINVYYAEDYMDVTAALDKVYDNFKEYADISDEEADIVIKANDEKKIDLSSFKDKQIVVVNMYASNYKDWQGNKVSTYYGEGQLSITNKADGQFVIMNLLGADGDAEVKRFSINGKNSGGLTDVDISDTVIFNAVNVSGKLNMGEICGIVVAPRADVTLTSTCNGRAIANTFVNINGQMHFISDCQQEGTTAKETAAETKVDESTKIAEETKVNETTKAAEETKVNETTKAVEETTVSDTTKADAVIKADDTTKAEESIKTGDATKKADDISGTDVTKKSGEVAGDEEQVTGKDGVAIDGSRVRKNGEVAANEEVVKTGDNNHVWVYVIVLVAAVVIFGTVIVISKKNNKK